MIIQLDHVTETTATAALMVSEEKGILMEYNFFDNHWVKKGQYNLKIVPGTDQVKEVSHEQTATD